MNDLKVWLRQGDNDDYHDFPSPYDAGYEVGSWFSQIEGFEQELKPRYRGKGLELPGFESYNYISLFWGGDDAQDSEELNNSDRLDFEQGLKEGLEL